MVKVREFCCGCSLRSGTFTIAWGLLIYSTLLLTLNVSEFFALHRRFAGRPTYYYTEGDLPSSYIFAYTVIRTFVGIAISATALYALHKNKIILLNGLHWYLCYMVASFILSVILIISEPEWEMKLVETHPGLRLYNFNNIETALMYLISYIFMAGIIAYFSLIVKSYRDYSLRNEAQNVQFVGPDATTVGYIAA